MMTANRRFAAATLLLLLAGCAHHYTPRTSTYPFPGIEEFSSSQAVALVNTQTATAPVLYGDAGFGREWYGNLQEWTEVAIALTNRELSKRGMSIGTEAKKSLKLSVVSIKATTGGWGFHGYASLKAITGDGYERVFQGDSPAGLITRSADGAVMQAVAAMLSDKQIRAYLLASAP